MNIPRNNNITFNESGCMVKPRPKFWCISVMKICFCLFVLFVLILYMPVNIFSVMSVWVFLG